MGDRQIFKENRAILIEGPGQIVEGGGREGMKKGLIFIRLVDSLWDVMIDRSDIGTQLPTLSTIKRITVLVLQISIKSLVQSYRMKMNRNHF